MSEYYNKYIQYKAKYLELKNNTQIGGKNNENIIIHISGASGAGKTTLGNKIKDKMKNKVIVKDLDDLRAEFVEKEYGGYKNIWSNKNFKWNSEKYQQYINDFVNKQKKPIVFVGLNHMPWWNKNLYYNLHSQHNFFIRLSNDNIFEQKCSRFLEDVFVKHRSDIIHEITKNEKKTIKDLQQGLKHECGYNEITKMNEKWNKDYRNKGYKFLSREDIYKKIIQILK